MDSTMSSLEGLRVLVMPPARNLPLGPAHWRFLAAAKARWNWHLDILCEAKDQASFAEFASPSGRLFVRPNMLEQGKESRDTNSEILDQQLWDAQLATGFPTGKLLLAGQSTIGRAFVLPLRYMPHSSLGRRVLKDNDEPVRIVRHLYQFAEEMLAASSPDFVFTYEWAKPWRLAVWLAAARREIPCVVMRASKIASDRYFLTPDLLMFNTAAIERAAARRKSRAPSSPAAQSYLHEFRRRPSMVSYIRTKWQLPGEPGWFVWHGRFLRSLPANILRSLRRRQNQERASMLGQLLAYYRRFIVARRQRAFFQAFEPAELAALRYVYLPLHKETDLTLILQAALWQDQRNTVELLASNLPAGFKLLVREHRFNFGHRPTRLYKDLSRLPGVVLVNPFDSQFKYLANADLIVTENGSSGWEGLLLGRKVLTLDRTFYDGAGLAQQLDDPRDLGSAIMQRLAAPPVPDPAAHDHALACMIDAELETTFATDANGIEAGLERLAAVLHPLLRRGPRSRPAAVVRHSDAISTAAS